MKFGLPLSFVLHTTLVFGGLVFWQGEISEFNQAQIIPLELVSVSKITNIKPTIKKPPEPLPDDEPETLVQPIIPDTETPQENLADDTLPELATEPPEKPEEKAEVFDLDSFSAMIDRAREENPDVETQRILRNEQNSPEYADVNQGGVGAATGFSVSAPDYIRSKMKPCWPIDKGAKDYKNFRVEVRLSLDVYGEIASVRVLNSAQIIASPNNAWRAARDRVITALRTCAPYDGLLQNDYDEWKAMKLNFQPGDS